MKRFYKKLQQQITYIGNLINWFILFITRESPKCAIINNKKGKELRIIVNGPSLRIDEVITEDKNIEYCMVNQACLTLEFEKIRPSIYIIADPGYINKTDPEAVLLWDRLSSGVDWDMTVYLPYYMYKKINKIFKIGNKINLSFYHSASFQGWNSLAFWLYKKNLAIPGAGNVLLPSIYVGILKGYEVIKLFGSDHSWTEQLRVNKYNQVCVRQLHYYDNEENIELEPWKDEKGEQFTMKRILERFSNIFGQYEIIECFARSRNVNILNMCDHSYIDAFEKLND